MKYNTGELPTDSTGYELHEGDFVVYNLSGELATGTIKRIINKWRPSHYSSTLGRNILYFCGFIEVEYLEGGNNNKHRGELSKVRNPSGIKIIQRQDGTRLI